MSERTQSKRDNDTERQSSIGCQFKRGEEGGQTEKGVGMTMRNWLHLGGVMG